MDKNRNFRWIKYNKQMNLPEYKEFGFYGINILSPKEIFDNFYYIEKPAFVIDDKGIPCGYTDFKDENTTPKLCFTYHIYTALNKYEYSHCRNDKFKNKIIDKIKKSGIVYVHAVYLGEVFINLKNKKRFRHVYVRGSFSNDKL
jgi:hypothetical protein